MGMSLFTTICTFTTPAAALGEIGLKVIPGTNVRRRLKFFNAIAFYHPDRPQQRVDLHLNDVSVAWSDRSVLTGPKVWQEQHHIELAGRRLPTLSVERTLIHLCVHWGCHHQFRSMISLLDLLLLLKRRHELDAGRIRDLAAAFDCQRVLSLAMTVARALTGSKLGGCIDRSILSHEDERRSLKHIEALYGNPDRWQERRIKAICLDNRRARHRAVCTFLAAKCVPQWGSSAIGHLMAGH